MALTDDDKQWFKAELKRFEAQVERVEAQIERVEAQIEHVETALLTEFHKWAGPIEMRVRTHAAGIPCHRR